MAALRSLGFGCLRMGWRCSDSARTVSVYARQLKKASRLGINPEGEEKVFTHENSTGMTPEVRRIVASISSHVKAGDFEQALAFFESSPKNDPVVFNAAINTCQQALWPEKGQRIWDQMPAEFKTVVTYSTMISLYGRVRQVQRFEELLVEMKAARVEPNIITYNTLVNNYSIARRPEHALRTFRQDLKPLLDNAEDHFKQSSYLTVMAACAREGDYATVHQLFSEMVAADIRPNEKHFNALLSACASAADAVTAKGVFETMRQWGLRPRTIDYTALISCSRNSLPECQAIVEEMKQQQMPLTALTYQALFEAHVLAGDARGARALLEEAAAPTGQLPLGLDEGSVKMRRLLARLKEMEGQTAQPTSGATPAWAQPLPSLGGAPASAAHV